MRPLRALARTVAATAAVLAATGAATVATAPAAHAGCVDDYFASQSYYVTPDIESVDVSGGVVTLDTNEVKPDAKRVTLFADAVATHESGKVVTLATCIA